MTTLLNGLTVDRTITAQENFIALINSVSPHQYTGSEFTIGAASSETPSDPQEVSNTQVTITAVQGSGFTGSKTFRYNRMTLGFTRAGSTNAYTITPDDDQTSTIEQIMVDHNLVDAEVTVEGALPQSGQTAVWIITANAGSLLYVGQIGVTVHLP